jgi:hypothetical protein
MTNYLENGAVLPHGLLSGSTESYMTAFNKSYKNTAMRVGVVVAAYPVGDPNNYSNLAMEYDVVVIEQHEDRGSTTIRYKNCLSSESLGSLADFFERSLRVLKVQTKKGALDLAGQDGACVFIECLDGMSDKAVIIGAITHPGRTTQLIDSSPRLVGEYNGVGVLINPDGSCSLTFNGATDNQGVPTDPSQGTTTLEIQTDGSVQIMHSTITFTLSKSGVVTLTSTGDLNINCDNANITASGAANLTTSQDVVVNAGGNAKVTSQKDVTVTAAQNATIDATNINLGSGATDALLKGTTFAPLFNAHIHPTTSPGAPTGPPIVPLPPSVLSTVSKTE